MVAAVVRRRRARPHTPSWAVRRAMTSLRSSVRKDAQRVRFRVCLGTSDEVQATVSSNRIHPWTKLPGSRALALTAKGLLCFVDGKMYSKCSGRAALSPCRSVRNLFYLRRGAPLSRTRLQVGAAGVSLPSLGFNNGVSRGIIFNSLSYPDTIDRIFDARLEPLDCHISEKPLGHACV